MKFPLNILVLILLITIGDIYGSKRKLNFNTEAPQEKPKKQQIIIMVNNENTAIGESSI